MTPKFKILCRSSLLFYETRLGSCSSFASYKKKCPKSAIEHATKGLFWLDKEIAPFSKSRVPKKDLLGICRDGGHRAGLKSVFQLGHKVRDRGFLRELVDIADANETRNT